MSQQTSTTIHWLTAAANRAGLEGLSDLPLDPAAPAEEAWDIVARAVGVTEPELADRLAAYFHLAVADFETADPEALTLIPEKLARDYGVFPLRLMNRNLVVAIANPVNPDLEDAIAFASGRRVITELAPARRVQDAIEALYAPERLIEHLLGGISAEGTADVRVIEEVSAEAVSEAEAAGESVIKFCNVILDEAVRANASDIHIEPDADGGRIRFRVDGVLTLYLRLPLAALVRIVSRIKVLANLDIADRIRPQDGHFRVRIKDANYDLRVSTVPAPEAEKCVVRILSGESSLSLESLSFTAHVAERIQRLLDYRDGIIIITGPTGSGKTTTLYAALQSLATGELNISSVEDPIEYKMRGVTQIQVEPKREVTFASALRALMRQDPDVILVGEIRDLETAETAVRASLTGHLVLTTLHTNDALSAVPRLVDIGLDRTNIAVALRGVVAQRLVRRLCPACALPVDNLAKLPPRELRLIELYGVRPIMRSVGCDKCRQAGFKSRLPIAEVLEITPEIAEMIGRGAGMSELHEAAIASGMRTLEDAAMERVQNGETTLQEVERVRHAAPSPGAKPAADQPDAVAADSTAPTLLPASTAAPGASVAVLPFANLTGDKESDYLSDGITDDIVAALSKIRELRVIAGTTVRQYARMSETLGDIGRDLGVATVLEGSVRQREGKLRIVAQLFDASTNETVWAEIYDRKVEDLFEIQSDVAWWIARALQTKLSRQERERLRRRPTGSTEAYDLYLRGKAYDWYLRGRYLWDKRTEEGIRHSLEYFKQALAEDPQFTMALAGQADAYVTLGIYGVSPPEEVMPRARDTAQQALAIDGEQAQALTSLACVLAVYDWDWEGAEREFRRAIELDPGHATAPQWYAVNLLAPLGRFEEARTVLDQARALEPLSLAILTTQGVLSFVERDYDRAIEELRRVIELDDGFGLAPYFLGQCYTQMSRYDDAIAQLERAVELSGGGAESQSALGHAYAVAGREDEAREALQQLTKRSESRYVSPTLVAQIHIGLGEVDEAFRWLDSAVSVRAPELIWLEVRPVFDPLRDDPRFSAFLSTLGFPE